VSNQLFSASTPWGLSTEKFFYFFLGLRKGEIRKQVGMMGERFPDDSPQQLARRFISAQAPLSLLGGALMHLPMLIPAFGPALKLLGIATGSSVMIRLNMTLLLQIAMLFGQDIDDKARLKEMAAIIAASGAASGASMLPYVFNLDPRYKAVIGGASVMTVSQLIGEAAIRYYGRSTRGDVGAHQQAESIA